MAQSNEVPKCSHFYELGIELLTNFFQQNFEMLRYMVDSASVKQNEVKYLSSFCQIPLPKCLLATNQSRLSLYAEVGRGGQLLRLLGISTEIL